MVARFTMIGHSDRSLEEFLGMLHGAGVRLLVDVRAFPRSRRNPEYNIDRLPGDLAQVQIGYRHCSALGGRRAAGGGRRAKQPDVDPGLNTLWRVKSFHHYADYALGRSSPPPSTNSCAWGASNGWR